MILCPLIHFRLDNWPQPILAQSCLYHNIGSPPNSCSLEFRNYIQKKKRGENEGFYTFIVEMTITCLLTVQKGGSAGINNHHKVLKPPLHPVEPLTVSIILTKPFLLEVQNLHLNETSTPTALINAGANGNCMNQTTANELHINPQKLNNPLSLHTIDGSLIGSGQITHPLHYTCHPDHELTPLWNHLIHNHWITQTTHCSW